MDFTCSVHVWQVLHSPSACKQGPRDSTQYTYQGWHSPSSHPVVFGSLLYAPPREVPEYLLKFCRVLQFIFCCLVEVLPHSVTANLMMDVTICFTIYCLIAMQPSALLSFSNVYRWRHAPIHL